MMMMGVVTGHGSGYLEDTHGHAHPGHRHQVALHPLLARPQAAALVYQQAVVLLLLVRRGKIEVSVSLRRIRDKGCKREEKEKGILLTNESFLTSYPHCLFLITSSSLGLQQLKGTPQASLEPTATLEQLK